MDQPLQQRSARAHGQRGYSLVEVIIAILLASSVLLTLAMGFFTINRTTVSNERIQLVDAALVAYGEIIRTQIDYRPCRPDFSAAAIAGAYQGDAEAYITGNTGPGPGTVEAWLRPPAVVVELQAGGVDLWDLENNEFVTGCILPDSGVQLISYSVTYNPALMTPPRDGDPITRTGQVAKRKPARS